MAVVQFIGGPMDGKVNEVHRLEPTFMVRVSSVPKFSLIDNDPTKLIESNHVAYRRETFIHSICSNVLCDWSIVANVYVAHGTNLDLRFFDDMVIKPDVWQHRFNVMPKPDFLTQFEDWFLWTAYWVGAKCREVRSLEMEIIDAMSYSAMFIRRYFRDVENVEDVVAGSAMMTYRLDPFGFTRGTKR
jgi:hypothetical protein